MEISERENTLYYIDVVACLAYYSTDSSLRLLKAFENDTVGDLLSHSTIDFSKIAYELGLRRHYVLLDKDIILMSDMSNLDLCIVGKDKSAITLSVDDFEKNASKVYNKIKKDLVYMSIKKQ